ncbi:SDR family NAD(P)-dependent oxidoreductase [Patulibacter defluvii]|uniref:SDR family NAD(P)-dependent oxidoreductase n=1 Tax=Patulibacter defluvii TaxID=3095358 RepID=UPI002A74A59B|nr:SDR family NAD(P)-dependent oxidoreductase [Patulibacter sp. DM4]
MSLPAPSAGTMVLVTGAASGIGEQLARQLAGRGHGLLLVDRQAAAVEALAAELDGPVRVEAAVCDLTVAAQRDRLIARVQQDERALVGLCNNAGIMLVGAALEIPLDADRAQVAVNAVAVHHLALALAPLMVRRGEGAILNTASLAANQPLPGLATYAASKAFVHTLSEALHAELRGSGVSCTSLCPGATDTHLIDTDNGQRAARWVPGALWAQPAFVAACGIEGMVKGRRTVVPGLANRALLAPLGRYVPRKAGLPVIRGTVRRMLAAEGR